MRVKTSITIEEKSLETLKKAASRERRSVSNYLETFIDRIIPDVKKELAARNKMQAA
jgi:hypothetical protein